MESRIDACLITGGELFFAVCVGANTPVCRLFQIFFHQAEFFACRNEWALSTAPAGTRRARLAGRVCRCCDGIPADMGGGATRYASRISCHSEHTHGNPWQRREWRLLHRLCRVRTGRELFL